MAKQGKQRGNNVSNSNRNDNNNNKQNPGKLVSKTKGSKQNKKPNQSPHNATFKKQNSTSNSMVQKHKGVNNKRRQFKSNRKQNDAEEESDFEEVCD